MFRYIDLIIKKRYMKERMNELVSECYNLQ